jgi:hypothetical protein
LHHVSGLLVWVVVKPQMTANFTAERAEYAEFILENLCDLGDLYGKYH